MLHLDDDAIASRLDPVEVADALAIAFSDWGRGEADSTVRVRARAGVGMASAMAAVVPRFGVSGGKLYATRDGRFTFHVVLFDLDGTLLCTLDGAALTDARTPAICAVAIDHLAAKDCRSAAVLGTGRAAGAHMDMLGRVPGIDEIWVWGRRIEAAEQLALRGRRHGLNVVVAGSSSQAVEGADIVVTVTSANAPFVRADDVSDRALVCAVGATKPERCELDVSVFARAATVVADDGRGSRVECGDLLRAVDAGVFDWNDLVELRDVLAGKVNVARAGVDGPVVFETQGVALQDVVAAALVWQRVTTEPN